MSGQLGDRSMRGERVEAAAGSALARLRDEVASRADAIRVACVWEATAPKVGNVHPGASFDDCDVEDFKRAGHAVAPILAGERDGERDQERHGKDGVGSRILEAIRATRQVTRANVNLGIVLLIGPMAAAEDRGGLGDVLDRLTPEDGRQVYEAIRLANPGGMRSGEVEPSRDVTRASGEGIDLIAAMKEARNRDRIARQYADRFCDLLDNVVPTVATELVRHTDVGEGIVAAQMRLLATEPDSLILRKCGPQVAGEVRRRAASCWDSHGGLDPARVARLDRWLRADGNRRNPGTTADLIAAALFWLLRPA
ncbi:MAG: hypothetical protein RI963_531 [Planctomycetota bacterium]|jgi:triphosphoribosyl-dephospho-CoA synthase